MSRKQGKKKKQATKPGPIARKQSVSVESTENFEALQFFRNAISNRPGLIGFLLSLLQLFGHATWIMAIWYLSATGQAETLQSDSPMSWVIVGVLGISLLLTIVSLFVCLFYGLRRTPRLLPVIGFFLSFFVGVLATSLVVMQGLRSMSET